MKTHSNSSLPDRIGIALATLALFAGGCASIPNGGYHGDIRALGAPGDILSTISLGQGLLVATATLDKGRSVNVQINKDEPESYQKQPLYDRVLTIGKFSKIIGSGFARKENIFYRKRIWYRGKDVFEIEGDRYVVEWECDYRDPLTYMVADMYRLTFRALAPKD